jgi:protein-S-isoprenylcysteine O-methyltransferase Ste14
MIVKIIAFVILSAVLVYISRASLSSPRSHGFWRFFAWEFILALFLLNVEQWFVDPFAWHQVISWILLFASLVPLVFGVGTLITRGKAAAQRQGDPSLLAFEKTTELVTTGIYGYIRHPLYSSLLLLAWGIFFKDPGLIGGLLGLAASLCLYLTARRDEAECIRFFGDAYREYMKKTKRFVPYIL